MARDSAKNRMRQLFLDNIGEVVTNQMLREAAAPVTSFARRVRELREQEQWPILTQNDDHHLKSGEYKLVGMPPELTDSHKKAGISQKLRAEVLDRDGYTCQSCGLAAGDDDPNTGRKVRLHLGHIKDKSLGGENKASNLRTLCSTCNQGAKNVTTEKPSAIWLLSQVRRANLDDQRAVLEWLTKRFGQ